MKRIAVAMETSATFWRFATVGAFGFLVDAGVLTSALALGSGFYLGRVISFFFAVTFTWYLNRVFTFASCDPALIKEWLRFVSANTVGGLVNYLIYASFVTWIAWFSQHPVFAVGFGSLGGLIWNYFLSHKVVFIEKPG